eukprot:1985781-Pleurochrysis_carterae.AAC.1
MALLCPTPRMAMSLEQHLSPPTLPAPALEVVGHERIARWGRRPCPHQQVQAQPIPPQSPPQSVPAACSSRDSETWGPYQKVRASLFLLPIGREVSRAARRESI